MSLCGVVFLIFLLGKIFDWGPIGDWSWWLVFLPLIVELVIDVLIFGLFIGGSARTVRSVRRR